MERFGVSLEVGFPEIRDVVGLLSGFFDKLGREQWRKIPRKGEHVTAAELDRRHVGGNLLLLPRRNERRREI